MIEIKRPGLLHAKLGVPKGQPIPAPMIAKAKASPSPALRKEATFAQNAKGWSKGAKVTTPKAPAPASALHSRGHFEAQAKAHLAGAVDSHDAFSKL